MRRDSYSISRKFSILSQGSIISNQFQDDDSQTCLQPRTLQTQNSIDHDQENFSTLTTYGQTPSNLRKLAYSIGHIHNDLCSSMWFTFLLIFYKEIIGLSALKSANLILIGQVVDGLITPLVGVASDKIKIKWYTKRKFGHLVGTIMVAVGFPFVFHSCPFLEMEGSASQVDSVWYFVWYIPFIVLFQVGWGTIQINHLAIVPELTTVDKVKVWFLGVQNFIISVEFCYCYCHIHSHSKRK